MVDIENISFAAAKIIRKLTVPPIIALVLLSILYAYNGDIFLSALAFPISVAGMVLVPIMAYPLARALPRWKESPREVERNLAFILSIFGYLGVTIWGLLAHFSVSLLLVYFTYTVSVLALSVFNRLLKIRASGHACSVFGPLMLLVFFFSASAIIPCLILFALVLWASVRTQNHSFSDIIWGALCGAISFGVALAITSTYQYA